MAQKITKFIIFFICSLVILFFLITLLLPSTGKVVKETYIQANQKTVLGELTTLENYSSWYPWIQIDPTAEISYDDKGEKMHWVGKASPAAEDGEYRLTGLDGDSALHFEFIYRNTPPFTGAYILRSSGDTLGTTVVWYIKMKAGFTPWWRFYAAMMDKLTGPLMEAGLNNLKIVCEKVQKYSQLPVKKVKINKTFLATFTETAPQSRLYLALNESFDSIKTFISDNHLTTEGEPMAQFHELNNHTFLI
ncbi:MAG: SRPBCC family protein, partial [Chitinophagaceae bacterium]